MTLAAKQSKNKPRRAVTRVCAALVAVATLAICGKAIAWLVYIPNNLVIAVFASAAICTVFGCGLGVIAWLMDRANSIPANNATT